MRAVTIRQPWAWYIAHGPKRVENRAWDKVPGQVATARRLLGQRIAIHAGASIDRDAGSWLRAVGLRDWAERDPGDLAPRGAIVAVATLAQVVAPNERLAPDPWRSAGMWGLVLADVVALSGPVPCKGALGFWALSDPYEARVEAALWPPERRAAAARGLVQGHPGERPACRPDPR